MKFSPRNIAGRFIANLLIRSGNWQQLFDRGLSPDDDSSTSFTRPYAQSAWVSRAIKTVAEPIYGLPLFWTMGEKDYTNPELDAFWDSPVIGLDSYADFVSAWVGWLKLCGEAFLIADDSWALKVPGTVQLSKLILAPPAAMKERTQGGLIVAWEYTDANGAQRVLQADQVFQTKLWNPYNAYRGLGEMEAAQIAAEADYESGKYEANLARNSGDQGMTVTTDGGQPSKEQIDQITTQLRRKRERLQRGEYTDMFLAAGLKVQSPEPIGADMAFQDSRATKRHEIFVAFGVPPSLADVKASYSFGKDSDYRALIVNTCMPTAAKLARVITMLGRRMTGKPCEAYVDFDDHPVMQEVRRERVDTVAKLWALGMPLNAAGEYLDMNLPRVTGDDEGYLPFSVQPVTGLPPEQDQTFDENQPDRVSEMLRALRSAQHNGNNGSHAAPAPLALTECGFPSDAEIRASPNPRWAKQMRARRVTIKQFQSKLSRILMAARRETLANLAKTNAPLIMAGGRPEHRGGIAADIVFDLTEFAHALFAGMRQVSSSAVQDAGEQVWKEFGTDDPWLAPAGDVMHFTAVRQNKLKNVPTDIWEQIRDSIQDGMDEGDSTDDIARRIRETFNEIDRGRSKTIAVTETGAAYGYGNFIAQRDAGIERREWTTSGLSNVRPAHREAEGQIVGINEPFFVGDEYLDYPGDETGEPGNVINCHCIAVALPPEGDAT